MAVPVATDDSYATPQDTSLAVGRDQDFQNAGTTGVVEPVGFAGALNAGSPSGFIATGTAGTTTQTGLAGTLQFGVVQFGAAAQNSISGFAGSLQGQQAQIDEDFVARATASSAVLYATNFDDVYLDGALDVARSGIVTQQDLHDESLEPGPGSTNITVDQSLKLSGVNSTRITTLDSASTSSQGYFAFRPDGRSSTVRRRLYVQWSTYYPKETIGYRYELDTNTVQVLKNINLGTFGAGQVVLGSGRFMGFIGGLLNGNNGIAQSIGATFGTPNPWAKTVNHDQNAIDVDTGSTSTKTEWLTRYGPLGRGLDGDLDTSFDTGNPYLYNRVQPSGWPDTRAATNGVPWVLDGWTTLEAFVEYNETTPSQSSLQVWAAPYGEAPTLIISAVGFTPLGVTASNAWSRFELLNYDTERQSQVGIRPTMQTYYDEVIVSESPIKFPNPGGVPFVIPNNQGGTLALEQLIAGMSSGTTATYTGFDHTTYSWLNGSSGGQNLAWQTDFHHFRADDTIHIVGKAAAGQQGSGYKHALFDLKSETFLDEQTDFTGGNLGHAYGNAAMDPVTGDLYFQAWGDELWKYTYATGLWSQVGNHVWSQSGPPVAGLAYHPNPFGTGDRGVVMHTGSGRLYGFNIVTQSWHSPFINNGYGSPGSNESIGYFNPTENASYLGGGYSSDDPFIMRVDSAGVITQRANPQVDAIATRAGGTGADCGSVIESPDGLGNLWLLANSVAPTDNYWESTDGANSWNLLGTHPLNVNGAGPIITFTDFGAIGKVTQNGFIVWKI